MSNQFTNLADIVNKRILSKDRDKYISQEFQKYGYDLAVELEDLAHTALYIKIAKQTPRGIIESARGFVKDAPNVKNRGRLFMWKLAQIKAEQKEKSKK